MRSVFYNGPPDACPSLFNMAAHVMGKARDHGEKTALSVIGPDLAETWTYARLETAIRGTATGLLELGLTAGDRVLMRLGNSVDFPIAYLACIAVGLIPVPTSAQLTTPEVTKLAAELRPSLIIAGAGIALPDAYDGQMIGTARLREMRARPPADYLMGDPNRLGYIIYTSGTSGVPRAVCHAHRACWARKMMWDGWYGLKETDRLLHAGAFNWTYTLGTGLMDPWAIGATALIPAEGVAAIDLPTLLRDHEVTIFAAAPGVYRQILKHHDKMDLPVLRHGLSAGEKLPETTRDRWHTATGTPIFEAYGMSECSTFISGNPATPLHAGASGTPQTGRHVAILDPEGNPVPRGQAGTLAVHRDDPGLMLGYLDAPEDTAARFVGPWFLTGDTASMAEDDAVTYLGRSDDMMNAGGFRVSPIEVEAVLNTHPEIAESAAVEVLVKDDTTVIAAFYAAPYPLEETALAAFASARLARYKTPRLFIHVDALPKGANGKLLRRALRHTYEVQNGQA